MLEIIKNDLVEDLDFTPFNNDQSRIALIDADSMLYYCMKEDSTFDEMKLKLDNFIINVLSELKCKHFAPFITNSKTVFRKEFGKTREYKGNRKGRETPFLFYALRVYAQREWGFYDIPKIEADDAVAIYANGLGNNPFIESVICSPDKDVLRQIPGTHYNYQRNEFVSTTSEDAAKFLWIQCAAGDSVDGIPGIPGIGVKRAEKALDGIVEEDFSLKILKMYLQQMESGGISQSKEATDKFKETLDLVYVLRSSYDLNRLGISLPDLEYQNILKVLGKWQNVQELD